MLVMRSIIGVSPGVARLYKKGQINTNQVRYSEQFKIRGLAVLI
jgi:hypothetical protein